MATSASSARYRPGSAIVAAIFLGLPLAVGVLGACQTHAPEGSFFRRYTSHPVEKVEVVLFCCAIAVFACKAWRTLGEKLAGWRSLLPAWNGQAVPASEAGSLLYTLRKQPWRVQRSRLGRRVAAILDFVMQRQSANDLDDQLRALADEDAIALDASYSLTRFITWAIPILGFLGTVLGITGAISGVSPEVLENSLGSVTDGLALSFDTTAVALCLTMVTMFAAFLVERMEQGVLEGVDAYAERELSHRFVRGTIESDAIRTLVEKNGETLLQTTEQLVQKQAEIWAQSLGKIEARHEGMLQQQQAQLSKAIEAALGKTLQGHADRISQIEQQMLQHTGKLFERMQSMAVSLQALTATFHQIQKDEHQLVRLQTVMQQNLHTLAGGGAFEQAVHSLTAAIHMLTARHGLKPAEPREKAA